MRSAFFTYLYTYIQTFLTLLQLHIYSQKHKISFKLGHYHSHYIS